jgi:hypothetical protein
MMIKDFKKKKFINLTMGIMGFLFGNKKKVSEEVKPQVVATKSEADGDVKAAIALALYLYKNQLHDQETAVLTMNRVSRIYSPWSSKIYSMTRHPRGY